MKMTTKARFITQAAIIAALYAGFTLMFSFMAYDVVQLRIAEALTILPFFTPAAIPGLAVGCVIANLFSPLGWVDIVVGSPATLIAAVFTYKIRNKYLAPLPPVLVNTVFVGIELYYIFGSPILVNMGWVALGQTIVCYGLGLPLLVLLQKQEKRLFQ